MRPVYVALWLVAMSPVIALILWAALDNWTHACKWVSFTMCIFITAIYACTLALVQWHSAGWRWNTLTNTFLVWSGTGIIVLSYSLIFQNNTDNMLTAVVTTTLQSAFPMLHIVTLRLSDNSQAFMETISQGTAAAATRTPEELTTLRRTRMREYIVMLVLDLISLLILCFTSVVLHNPCYEVAWFGVYAALGLFGADLVPASLLMCPTLLCV